MLFTPVAVTGIGAVSAFGAPNHHKSGRQALVDGVFAGDNAIRPISSFDTSTFSCHFGAEVPDFDGRTLVRKAELHHYGKVSLMAMAAADEALAHAGLEPKDIAPFCGALMGTGFGPADAIQAAVIGAKSGKRPRPTTVVKMMLNSPTAALCARYGLQRASMTHVTACAASAHALAAGADLVAKGAMDYCLAGGSDAFATDALFWAWDALGVMTPEDGTSGVVMRPFDQNRSGFAIGEAAAVLVLERLDHAQQRGADILGIIAGSGAVTDTPSLTKPSVSGMMRAMNEAVSSANLHMSDIGHINAHGTATELNDHMEAQAISEAFGEDSELCISATKGAHGHCMGASSALEAVLTIEALNRQVAPPIVGLNDPIQNFALNFTKRTGSQIETKVALSNSFAFGGHFVSLAFQRP